MLAVGYEGFTGYNKIFTADDRMLYVNGNGDIVQNNDLHNLMPEHPEVLSYICNTLSPLQGVELSFETEIVNNTVVITGFKDGVSCENILIPNMLFGLPVAEIGAEAFKDRVDLNSVIISSNVALIGKNAFLDCRALESVGFYGLTAQNAVITIPDGVQIGAGAFSGCYAIKKFAASDANQYHTVVDGVLYDK
ncbi:MAG: leucine-rich repeat domain-containing protein, partial [Clostridiales bacterium]|nr:leucine-rich repeat domain-containing protein [Clostridiales bacterium]